MLKTQLFLSSCVTNRNSQMLIPKEVCGRVGIFNLWLYWGIFSNHNVSKNTCCAQSLPIDKYTYNNKVLVRNKKNSKIGGILFEREDVRWWCFCWNVVVSYLCPKWDTQDQQLHRHTVQCSQERRSTRPYSASHQSLIFRSSSFLVFDTPVRPSTIHPKSLWIVSAISSNKLIDFT